MELQSVDNIQFPAIITWFMIIGPSDQPTDPTLRPSLVHWMAKGSEWLFYYLHRPTGGNRTDLCDRDG